MKYHLAINNSFWNNYLVYLDDIILAMGTSQTTRTIPNHTIKLPNLQTHVTLGPNSNEGDDMDEGDVSDVGEKRSFIATSEG